MTDKTADKYIGKKLDGRYQVVDLIGVGGMSYVYKATDLKTGDTVAVKILKDEFSNVSDLVRRFRNESKAVRMLDNDNIVKILDVNFSDAVQYIVMEYLEGITLKRYIERHGALTWKQTVFFSEQLLRALQHAHDRGIIHRDMKPQNVMITQNGKLKVMDFGIARFSRSSLHTITDKAIGTVHYISPEQAKGEETDSRADIYSVGVMMYEMCTGKTLFDSDNAVSVAIKQISDKAPKIGTVNPDVPEGLQSIIEKAMEKDPNDRYQSAGAMLTELENFRRNPGKSFEYKTPADADATSYIDMVAKKRVAAQVQNKDRNNNTMAKKERAPKVKKEKPLRPKTINFPLALLMGLTFVCLIGSLVLMYMTLKNAGSSLFTTPEEIELPEFVGKQLRDIQADPLYSKFRFTVEEEFSNDVPLGTVFDQTPKAPKTVKENARVTLYVSKGIEVITVPAIVGDTYGNAVSILQNLGLVVYRELDANGDFEPNQITKTDPEVGTSVEAGSIIRIYVNSPATTLTTTVPNVIGQNATDAIAALMANGLVKGEVTIVKGEQEGHEDIKPGCVVSQSIKGGTRVGMRTTVNLVIREQLYEREWNFRLDAPFTDPSGNFEMTAVFYKEGETEPAFTVENVDFETGIAMKLKGKENVTYLIKINGIDYRKVELNFQEGTSQVVADFSKTNRFVMDEAEKFRITGKVAEGEGSVTSDKEEVYKGRSAVVTIIPESGYSIASVTDNGKDVTSQVSDGKYTINNVTENHTVTAKFQRSSYTVTVTVNHGSGSTSATTSYGGTLTFNVTPDEGFVFESTSAGTYSNGVLTVSGITGDMNITVNFKEDGSGD